MAEDRVRESGSEVAVDRQCRLIGANLNHSPFKDALCPGFFANKGAIFEAFSSRIVATALTWERKVEGNWYFKNHV